MPSPDPDPDPKEPPDPVLAAERAHLVDSRAALQRMRTHAHDLFTGAGTGADPVSDEYVKAALWRRMRALEDDPGTPLFFGRLDFAPGSAYPGESHHVGRRHVNDERGEALVVDWRAEVSRAFYRASRGEPMGVERRRRFGFRSGQLTAYEDEALTAPGADRPAAPSALLEAEIERPRTGPMRDIVATIQPEQDDIVRADLSTTVCVQGAPGTGKTAVGLHRAAFLLYAHRQRLARSGVLVVGPNDSFLRYIGDVLPALGEVDARQATLTGLLDRVPVRGSDAPEVATLKGDARLAEVLRQGVWSHVRIPEEGLVVPRGSRRWRVPTDEAAAIVAEMRQRGVRYAAGRALLHRRLAGAVLLRLEAAGQTLDERGTDALARSRPVRAYVDAVWPALDPVRLVHRLLSDREFLAAVAAGVLDEEEQAALMWDRPPRSAGAARWSLADAALVDEAGDLIERTGSEGHVVLDEAQDLSPMQLRAVGRRCSTGSLTVLGDLAQGTTPWATPSWPLALDHLGKPDAVLTELTVGFRVPGDVLDFATALLPLIAPGLTPPTSVRRGRGDLTLTATRDVAAASVAAVQTVLQRSAGSVGVVVPDGLLPRLSRELDRAELPYAVLGDRGDIDARVDLAAASLTKGLEFDHVVLVEPAEIVAAEPDERTGLRRLYVCLTRAVTSLTVVSTGPLPQPLAGRAVAA